LIPNPRRLGQLALFSSIALAVTIPAVAATHARHATSAKSFSRHAAKPKVAKIVGQRSIEDDRATQIQTALIKAGYLTGTPSGHWDAQSEAAMGKLQADNGWQTKLVPDSRALIKLGLGPGTSPASSSGTTPASAALTDNSYLSSLHHGVPAQTAQ
jgi:peptidoglycan hydrolase-like protein with peptidoglycan-binding domain